MSDLFFKVQFDQINEAEKVFQQSKIHSQTMFLTMIKGKTRTFRSMKTKNLCLGYLKHEMVQQAFDLFEKITNPNEILLIQIFNTCAKLENQKALNCGRKFFEQMPIEYEKHQFLMNSAFNMFIKCGDSTFAERIFKKIPRFCIGYGRLMKTFNLEKQPEKTLDLYEQMKHDKIKPDRIIYLLLINACAQIGLKSICQQFVDEIPKDLLLDHPIQTSLIHMWVRNVNY